MKGEERKPSGIEVLGVERLCVYSIIDVFDELVIWLCGVFVWDVVLFIIICCSKFFFTQSPKGCVTPILSAL